MEDTSNTTSYALDSIKHLDPCVEAQDYLATQPDPATAWRNCQRGDWMLWLAARINLPRPLIVLAACDCVRTALRHTPVAELRPLLAIEAAEAWAANPTEDNRQLVIQARRAACVASNASAAAADARASAADAYASVAACAVASAADAVTAAASAAASAAYAANGATYSASAAAAAAACAAVAHATNAALYASAASTYASTAASAYASAADAARKQAQAQHADLVRARITAKLVANALAR